MISKESVEFIRSRTAPAPSWLQYDNSVEAIPSCIATIRLIIAIIQALNLLATSCNMSRVQSKLRKHCCGCNYLEFRPITSDMLILKSLNLYSKYRKDFILISLYYVDLKYVFQRDESLFFYLFNIHLEEVFQEFVIEL